MTIYEIKLLFYSKAVTSPLIFVIIMIDIIYNFMKDLKGRKSIICTKQKKWDSNRNTVYDLCEATPTIQTGSIMMLKVAMYMGYKRYI